MLQRARGYILVLLEFVIKPVKRVGKMLGVTRRKMFPFALGAVLILLPVVYLILKNPREVKAAPWSANHGEYTRRKQLTLVNNSGQTFEANSTYQVSIDTQTMASDGDLKPSCDDLRVVYQPSDTSATELKRNVTTAQGAANCSTSAATIVSFPLQSDLANSATNSNYYLYYGNPSATAYSTADALDAYNIGAKEATFVAPFNGTTTALAAGSGAPTTESGAIRYSGGKSALNFDRAGDFLNAGSADNLDSLFLSTVTYEFWANLSTWGQNAGGSFVLQKGPFYLAVSPSGGVVIYTGATGTMPMSATGTDDFPLDHAWHNVAITYNDAGDRKFHIWIDGREASYGIQNAAVGTLYSDAAGNMIVGNNQYGTWTYNGLLDEIRISNVIRYTSNFTPSTAPFVRDANTKLLLHFDENGDDPRNTGKAIDDSGNGNHGTITGAKYVSGFVGVDNNSTTTGYQQSQSYASHGGVFIEEGTTNVVTNPSFENATSFSQNWTSASDSVGYSSSTDTFTPLMAKRNSAGPFAAGPVVQGDWGTGDTNGDLLTFPLGSAVSGYFYSQFDRRQGTVVLWYTPEYNSATDTGIYTLLSYGTEVGLEFYYHSGAGVKKFYAGVGGQIASSAAKTLTAGTTYNIVLKWVTDTTLDGTNHICITVDNGTPSCGAPTNLGTGWLGDTALKVGQGTSGSVGAAGGIIEGLTIYRRPLYSNPDDVEGNADDSGINVGNGDEIEQIYNAGAGKDPTLVTGSWDVVFCLPTNATTEALTSPTDTDEAWTHPHASNLIPGNTNKGGFMMNGTYTTDGWSLQGDPSAVAALGATEKIYAGGYKTTSDAANEGLYQDITVTAGQDLVVRALAHSDTTSIPKIELYDQTNGASIGSLTGTNTSTRTAPNTFIFTGEAPAGCTTVRVKLTNTQASGIVYWHQVEVLNNLLDNPSMETGAVANPWIPTGWNNSEAGYLDEGDSLQDLSTVHTGLSSFRLTAGATASDELTTRAGSYTYRKFYSLGGFLYGNGVAGPKIETIYEARGKNQADNAGISLTSTSASWIHRAGVMRADYSSGAYSYPVIEGNSADGILADDIYAFQLTDVSLTVTPASEANSTETSGLRVDGRDYLSVPITNLTASNGTIRFKFTPRHTYSVANLFGSAAPVIFEAYGNSQNYIKGYFSTTGLFRVAGLFNNVAVNSDWTADLVLTAGTTYDFKVSYLTGGNLTLTVDGVSKATTAMSTNAFLSTAVPALMYFGSDDAGANQYDGTFAATALATSPTLTAQTTAPYYKFGSQSASMVQTTDGGGLTISLTPASSVSHTLSAYVYDGTTGNVGGTVDAKIANLVFDGEAVPATYTDTGGGWWRLSYSPTYTGKAAFYTSLASDADQGLYTTASNKWLSQGFKLGTSTTIDKATLWLKKVGAGSPTTTYYQVTVEGDSSSKPNGVIAATSNCAVATTSTSYTASAFTFASPPSLTAGTQYHLVLKPFTDSGCTTAQPALNATNYISWGYDSTASTYGNGDRSTGTGAAWTAVANSDHIFAVYSPAIANTYGVHVGEGKTVYVDGVQLETKSAYMAAGYITSYTDGTLGSNYAWSGEAHNSASTRTSTQLTHSPTSNIDSTTGTVTFWLKAPYAQKGGPWDYSGAYFSTYAGDVNWINGIVIYRSNNGSIYCGHGSTIYNLGSVSDNAWNLITATWNGNTSACYINTSQIGSGDSGSGVTATGINVGWGQNWSNYIRGSATISNFRIYNAVLSSAEIADVYYSSLGSRIEQTGGVVTERYSSANVPPILNWKLNEKYGTTAYDSTINLDHGTISGATWDTGVQGGALSFDGINDYVYRTYSFDTELDPASTDASVSLWLKHKSTAPASQQTLLSRYSSGGYKLYMNTSGYICLGVDDDSTWNPDFSTCSTASYANSTWHFAEGVIDRANNLLKLYIDGDVVGTPADITTLGSLSGSSPTLYLGIDSDGAANPYEGLLDDLRIFAAAKAANNVLADYNSRGTGKGVNVSMGGGDVIVNGVRQSLSSGLVGYWKMDEASWAGVAGEVIDSSGNANHGVRVGNATTTVGKFGNGGTFDGTNDYVNAGSGSSLDDLPAFTYSAWIYRTASAHATIVDKNAMFYIYDSGQMRSIRTTSGGTIDATTSNTLTNNKWYFLVATYNDTGDRKIHLYIDGKEASYALQTAAVGTLNSDSAVDLRIGAVPWSSSYRFPGRMDEVRIYNRALTDTEVRALYQYAPGPKVHLMLEDATGTTAQDSSGNSRSGTLRGNPIWGIGKYGNGTNLDGTGDYVEVNDF